MELNNINLSEPTIKALEEMGFTSLSPIQKEAIPHILEKRDIIGQAQTGTGKTAAFAIPAIELTNWDDGAVQHLVLAPTRELANQIATEFERIGKYNNIRVAKIVGGVSYDKQRTALKKKPQVVVATPGRLNDLIERKKIKLTSIRTFILDEADEMLKQGFKEEIEKIIMALPTDRVNMLFTATFDKKLKDLATIMLNDPVNIQVSSGMASTSTIKQYYVETKEKTKFNNLVKFLEASPDQVAVIFGRTKRRVDELAEALRQVGFKARGLQGDLTQKQREFIMDGFRREKFNILVATDVVARGIDVNGIQCVYNFDMPQEIEYYTHRIGRTGRAGRKGKSVSFVKPSELFYIKKIATETHSEIIPAIAPTVAEIRDMRMEDLLNGKKALIDAKDYEKFFAAAKQLLAHDNALNVVSAMLQGDFNASSPSAHDISLTGEPGISDKSGRSGGRSRGRSRGRNRDRSGRRSDSSEGGRPSRGRGDRGRGDSRRSEGRSSEGRSEGRRSESRSDTPSMPKPPKRFRNKSESSDSGSRSKRPSRRDSRDSRGSESEGRGGRRGRDSGSSRQGRKGSKGIMR